MSTIVACICCSGPCSPNDPVGSMCRACWYLYRCPRGGPHQGTETVTRPRPKSRETVTTPKETVTREETVTRCLQCGQALTNKRGQAAYCSPACRQIAYRKGKLAKSQKE